MKATTNSTADREKTTEQSDDLIGPEECPDCEALDGLPCADCYILGGKGYDGGDAGADEEAGR